MAHSYYLSSTCCLLDYTGRPGDRRTSFVEGNQGGSGRSSLEPALHTLRWRGLHAAKFSSKRRPLARVTRACKSRCEPFITASLEISRPAKAEFLGEWTLGQQIAAQPTITSPKESLEFDQPQTALDLEILALKRLVSKLELAPTLEGKQKIINSDARVQAVFNVNMEDGSLHEGKRMYRKLVNRAKLVLDKKELFLLQCMVAAGQAHLLDFPPDWYFREKGGQDTKVNVGHVVPSSGPGGLGPRDGPYPEWSECGSCEEVVDKVSDVAMRKAFMKLAELIGEGSIPFAERSACFQPSGELKLEQVLPLASDVHLVASGWESGWENPGPSQVLREWAGTHLGDVSLFSDLVAGWDATSWQAPWEVKGGPQFLKEWESENEEYEGRSGGFKDAPTAVMSRRDCDCEEAVQEAYPFEDALKQLTSMLAKMDKFYSSIGGIIGYQLASLELIRDTEAEGNPAKQSWAVPVGASGLMSASNLWDDMPRPTTNFHMPVGKDLSQDKDYATQAIGWGLQGLPLMGEMYPLGGAGDRLGLVDEATGECLPVAMLPYCGRTLLEGLLRDLQAREYLHFRLTGVRTITPVAIMTSAAKKNHTRVSAIFESHAWFGRGKDSFRLFEQPLVPAVRSSDGQWLAQQPLGAVQKPGGHGAIWKLAHDEGIFAWFRSLGRRAATIRQISNPMAGVDGTLLALTGTGLRYKKKFGFASCDRNVGTAEGVNVVQERRNEDGTWTYGVSCVEYTEFEKLGILDVPVTPDSTRSKFPANTNVLYVDLEAAGKVASSHGKPALPGMIMNLKKPIKFIDYRGQKHSVKAGRLECTMQNIADELSQTFPRRLSPTEFGDLDTFLLYNDRRKVTSSAKRQRKVNDVSLHQTPDGSFLDLMRNAREILTSCGVAMPEMLGHHEYLIPGPPFIVLFHPALGPLWDVIRQKISGGSLAPRAEVQLEIAELAWRDVHVDGSLLIRAENLMGMMSPSDSGEELLEYGKRCGRCRLERVNVKNAGIDWDDGGNLYWQHKVARKEALRVILQGNAEFEARDVTIEGSHTFEVPDGHRMYVTASDDPLSGALCCRMEPLPSNKRNSQGSWHWKYTMESNGNVHLDLVD